MFTTTLRTVCLIAATVSVVGVTSGCRGSISHKTPVHLNWNMDDQAYLRSQEPSEFFEDGRGMREPVEHTIAQGELRTGSAYETGIENGRYVNGLPDHITLDDALLERGQERYNIYCTPCHGEAGTGHGSVPAYAESIGTSWVIPDFHDEGKRGYSVGRIYHVASEGFGTMPSYKAQISQDDRWAIAAWVKALQQMPGSASPDAEEGR